MMRFLVAICLFQSLVATHAQVQPAELPKQTPAAERNLTSLKTIAEPLATALAELENLQNEIKKPATEDAKQEIQNRIDAERERVKELRGNFRDVLGGSEAAEYDGVSAERAGVQEQITELVQPMLSEIRDATSKPRELDALRKSLDVWKERNRKTETVLSRIDDLISISTDKPLISELQSARRLWASRQAGATSQIAVISVQIDERTRDQKSMWESLSGGFSKFFRSRGMNLLFAFLAAIIGFFASRKIYSWIRHISPVHKKDKNNFTSRLSDVLAMGTAVLVALAGIILVFYIRGDWLLLTLVVIFLIGVAWAGKTAIPPYLEQIRMILNLGSVREGERVVYLGLPWRVSALGFFTKFVNPSLQGGILRVPIRDVMAMISRVPDAKEPWFPSETDDWVVLSDGTFGKTLSQTPEQVVVLHLGGSLKTYPTREFLALSPENLSHGFRLTVSFGIDYRHQAESTSTIPKLLKSSLTTTLIQDYGREAIRSIHVEFASASSSSLDYEILADFDGSVAHKYKSLARHIQCICVDTSNENNWIIPFTQITLHQAGPVNHSEP
ncbi:MAG: hypothetical protein H7Y36_11230 [Armatimonadetes bacterium]|nr:hypothetical protein [Akkermansiaceae bacterium]